uniref:Uncharacterized protein n=1 Tax=Ixodes ricinus TaxID=34613 RepID=A0A6B0ULN8_IXORI
MAWSSKGRMLLRLMTSQSMPTLASSCAASRQVPTALECDTRVTCCPARSTLALPMGRTKSLLLTSSGTSNEMPYMSSFSRKTTGSGSRMAALRSPLQSSELYGEITLRPGQWPYQAA